MKYIKYSINAIPPVTDNVLLTQNSVEESVHLIFPSICLYVHPHLNACVSIIQALTEPEETFMTVRLQFVQTGVHFKGWWKVLFWFSSHLILE